MDAEKNAVFYAKLLGAISVMSGTADQPPSSYLALMW